MSGPVDRLLPGTSLEALREQLVAAAAAFTNEAEPLGALLRSMLDDVERAAAEPLEIFPVKHHSAASALHLLQRLRRKAPRVLFLEGCEDLAAALEGLEHCRFPVALQAYAPEAPEFPESWTPLSVVLPLTEFSAEYQALAYCRAHPETRLVLVDRSADHVFQWLPRDSPPPGEPAEEADPDVAADDAPDGERKDTAHLHGGAVGLRIGALEPTFQQFLEVLLQNARVRHYSEWWSQYVEAPTLGADYATYRAVFFLVGSLVRRLGLKRRDLELDEQRERYMWTRMRQSLREQGVRADEALYVCGAAHAVSPIAQFGVRGDDDWPVPPRTSTRWLYGLVPSSYAAIEHQFALPAGAMSIAQRQWEQGLAALGLEPYRLEAPGTKASRKARAPKKPLAEPPQPVPAVPSGASLQQYLTRPPAFMQGDQAQLLEWCSKIVSLARKNGYAASTADAIAIYQTALLLAALRNRPHPSPYDFQDAAVTCLEKDRVPRRRNVLRLCQVMLGGDRIGKIGYESLPPLARDLYDRLAPLGVDLQSSRIQRALMDFTQRPELLPASDLLWKLRYLGVAVRPILGERTLGHKPRQESWDIEIGKHQRSVIELGYEGMTVEQVLERRLKTRAFRADARSVDALAGAEDSLLYLKSTRLTAELGQRAVELLRNETSAGDAPEIFQRVRRLVHHYRTVGLPEWIRRYVSTGYQQYCTLLPGAFTDRGTTPQQLAAMLAFIFTQEALAFSMGCQRSQLLIAVQQAAPEDPPKRAILWVAEWLVGLRTEDELRGAFVHLLEQPLLLPAFPDFLAGVLLSLELAPRITRVAVELLSRAFGSLPDSVLVPWMPKLIVTLRPLGAQALAPFVKEAGLAFPPGPDELERWQFAWDRAKPAPPAPVQPAQPGPLGDAPPAGQRPEEARLAALLRQHPAALDALAARLGLPAARAETAPMGLMAQAAAPGPMPRDAREDPLTDAVARLLAEHPAALQALAQRL
jgi:hypothetical protein